MKRLFSLFFPIAIFSIVFLFLVNGCDVNRTPPETLMVYVPVIPIPHEEFYSLPHAHQIIKEEQKFFIEMPLAEARTLRLRMAEGSKNDFDCAHGVITWWLIDRELWSNYCRWNNKGEWLN